MPTYTYYCEVHKEFDVQQSIKDDPIKTCPKCEEEGLKSKQPKKLITLTSFVLKGDGWARDNYK